MSGSVRGDLVALLPRLRRFAFTLCGNRHDADDLVQTACEKALSRLDQFQEGTRLDSWMFRIVQTTFLDSVRQRHRQGLAADPEILERVSDEGRAARQANAALHLAKVRQAVSELPEDQRSVLALVAIEGFSYREAADVLDIPQGTVMSRLSRARARLASLAVAE